MYTGSNSVLRENAQRLKDIIDGIVQEPEMWAWRYAIALDWLNFRQYQAVWFKEDDNGKTFNGLQIVDENGHIINEDIAGFESDDDKFLWEATLAWFVMDNVQGKEKPFNFEEIDDASC